MLLTESEIKNFRCRLFKQQATDSDQLDFSPGGKQIPLRHSMISLPGAGPIDVSG
jgi:hypothetical protein